MLEQLKLCQPLEGDPREVIVVDLDTDMQLKECQYTLVSMLRERQGLTSAEMARVLAAQIAQRLGGAGEEAAMEAVYDAHATRLKGHYHSMLLPLGSLQVRSCSALVQARAGSCRLAGPCRLLPLVSLGSLHGAPCPAVPNSVTKQQCY